MLNLTHNSTDNYGKKGLYIGLVTSLTAVGVLTLSANIVVLITLFRFRSKYLKKSTRYFLMYKCLGHVCQGGAIMARPHVKYTHCVHFGWFSRTVLGITIGGMFFLSLDSFITITKPYRHKFIMTPRTAMMLMFLSCMLHIFFILLSVLIPAPPPGGLLLCTQNNSEVNPWVIVGMCLLSIVTIFMAMGLQAHNIWSLRKQVNTNPPPSPAFPVAFVSNAVEPTRNNLQNTNNNNNNNKVTRLDRLQCLLTVWVISILVCWMPTLMIVCIQAIVDIRSLNEAPVLVKVQPFFTVLPLVDGLLQPCLAVALSQELRSEMKKLFCCFLSEGGVSTVENNGGVADGSINGNAVQAISAFELEIIQGDSGNI